MHKSKDNRKVQRHKGLEIAEQISSPEERYVETIMQRERTEEVNSEGYHFIRPRWHHWVYGGGKQSEKD